MLPSPFLSGRRENYHRALSNRKETQTPGRYRYRYRYHSSYHSFSVPVKRAKLYISLKTLWNQYRRKKVKKGPPRQMEAEIAQGLPGLPVWPAATFHPVKQSTKPWSVECTTLYTTLYTAYHVFLTMSIQRGMQPRPELRLFQPRRCQFMRW
jgi:hypothetical protein